MFLVPYHLHFRMHIYWTYRQLTKFYSLLKHQDWLKLRFWKIIEMHKHTSYTSESQLCSYSYITLYLQWLLRIHSEKCVQQFLYTLTVWDDNNWIRTEAKQLAGIRDLNLPLAENGGWTSNKGVKAPIMKKCEPRPSRLHACAIIKGICMSNKDQTFSSFSPICAKIYLSKLLIQVTDSSYH